MPRPWAKRLGRVLVALVAVALVLPLLAVEGLYLYGLHLVGDLPPAPVVRLPGHLDQAVWTSEDGGGFAVEPRYPWHTVTWLVRAKFGDARAALHDTAPGEHACNRAAQLWLTQRPIEARSLKRTLAEWAVAKWCTRHWTASEVAQALAEHEYFGRHLRGLAAAAQGYFGKGPEALAPHELALLLGLPQSPAYLNPDCHPDRALQRRGFILALGTQRRSRRTRARGRAVVPAAHRPLYGGREGDDSAEEVLCRLPTHQPERRA